jgi:hypothetical protein
MGMWHMHSSSWASPWQPLFTTSGPQTLGRPHVYHRQHSFAKRKYLSTSLSFLTVVSTRPHSLFTSSSHTVIMVGRFQPYLYDAHIGESSFNPKAVTMASRMPPSPTKKKQDGPLIDFNKHPDSYLILPYGNTNVKPMNKRTKLFVKVARGIQLFFRVCTLLGAVGVLLCGIFIRGATDTEGYIMRISV